MLCWSRPRSQLCDCLGCLRLERAGGQLEDLWGNINKWTLHIMVMIRCFAIQHYECLGFNKQWIFICNWGLLDSKCVDIYIHISTFFFILLQLQHLMAQSLLILFGCSSENYTEKKKELILIFSSGIFFVLPCIETYQKVDLRTITLDVPPQEVGILNFDKNIQNNRRGYLLLIDNW